MGGVRAVLAGAVVFVGCGSPPTPWGAAGLASGGSTGVTGSSETSISSDDDGSSTDASTTSSSSSESSEAETTADSTSADTPQECADLGPWRSSPPFVGASHPLPSFAVGSWFYVHTIGDADARVLLSASASPDGELGPWQTASPDHGGGPHGYTAIAAGDAAFHFRNGHIARYVLDDHGFMQGDVELLEDDVTEAFGGERYVWDSAVLVTTESGPSAVVHLGGYSFQGSAYRSHVTRGVLPLGPRFDAAGPDHPSQRAGKAAFVRTHADDTGFVFMREGADGSALFRSTVDSTAVGSWTQPTELPGGTDNQRGDMFTLGNTLVVVQGSAVWTTDVDEAGDLGTFQAMPLLPEPQIDVTWGDGHLEGAAWGVIDDHVYLTGAHRVFDAEVRWRPCT